MAAAAGVIVGLLLLACAAALAFDFKGFGTNFVRIRLYSIAPIWSRDPRPDPGDVNDSRWIYGCVLAMLGLIVLIASLESLS